MKEEEGRRLWAELHAKPLEYAGWLSPKDQTDIEIWLERFSERVAAAEGGCACGSEWRVMLLGIPPDLRSAGTFYLWTCQMHDRVNQRLGKPSWLASRPPVWVLQDPNEAVTDEMLQ